MWPSQHSWNWNSMDVGPHRDLVGEFARAIRNKTYMNFGLYHSLYEWFHPLYLADKANNFQTQDFVREKTLPELYEIVNRYKPDIIWSDGDWEASDSYWNSTQFLAWLYNDSPVKTTVVTNDRWGSGDICKHGGYFTCSDRYNPGVLQNHKWENTISLDRKSRGYRRDIELSDVVSIKELIAKIAETVSCGGNLLVNIGPTLDGNIPPIFEERLRQMGAWLKVNAEGIYGTQYTSLTIKTTTAVYAIIPVSDIKNTSRLHLGSPVVRDTTQAFAYLLGYDQQVPYSAPSPDGGVYIDVTSIPNSYLTDPPFNWAWVIRMLGLDNV
ncbi:Alpha-L-fucosidase [Mizuhopecten yessoensis]|uniref:alpha-L-fucosidase n=1 Tax=Mizuhopecten yessoensis TaxID=6573 RepID=A0A210R4R6_MIZYE|nr:Alpha-L-fucosidase [Mizuhopecten yessoensis]